MKLLFHAAVICVFATIGADAFAQQQQRIEIQTRLVEFPIEQRDQPPGDQLASAPEEARGAITLSAMEALLAPARKEGVSYPKDAAELAGHLEKARDNTMCYKTPVELAGIVTNNQEAALERLFLQKGFDVWKTGTTTIVSGGKAQVGLTHKSIAAGPREVGETADVTVVIGGGADDGTLDLSINPRSIGLIGWLSKEDDGKQVFAPASKKAAKGDEAVFSEGGAEKPLTVSIWDGQTVMVKGEKLEVVVDAQGGKPKLVYKGVIMMITARLVDQGERSTSGEKEGVKQ